MIGSYGYDITIKRTGGQDQWGDPNSPTTETRVGILLQGDRMVRDRFGNEVVSTAMVEFADDVAFSYNDLITVNDVDRAILSVQKPTSFSYSVTKVYLA